MSPHQFHLSLAAPSAGNVEASTDHLSRIASAIALTILFLSGP